MSKNLDQIFTTNPITTNASTDLMYFSQSPYGSGNDAAMTFQNFSAQFASFPSTSTSNQVLLSVASLPPVFSTATYPGTTTINQLLYSSSANVIVGLATADSGVLITSSAGVPSISSTLPSTVQNNITGVGTILSGTWSGSSIAIAQGGTGKTLVTTVPAVTSWAGWDASKNFSANNFIPGYTSTNTAGGTTTLLVSSSYQQYFTGTMTQTVKMPVVSTLVLGQSYLIVNRSTGTVTVESSGSNTITTLNTGDAAVLTSISTVLTTAAGWSSLQLGSNAEFVWTIGTGTDSGIGGDGTAVASGNYSLAYGDTNSLASDNNSFVFGTTCTSNGTGYNFCFGNSCTNSENFSFAFGNSSAISTGSNNFVFGTSTSSGGTASFSFAFGNSSVTSSYSLSFGNSCQANGLCSFSFGFGCVTNGLFGFAIGNHAASNNSGSVVWGDSNSTPVPDFAANQWQTTFEGGYYFNLTNSAGLAVQIDSAGNLTNVKGLAILGYTIEAPSSGGTVTLNSEDSLTILNPSGTLTTLTIDMPPSPVPGQLMKVSTTQIITSLTVSGNGHTIIGQPTTLVVGQAFSMIYDLGTTTWYPA
jgi:hypothetical protein